jgi:hypothetical protein
MFYGISIYQCIGNNKNKKKIQICTVLDELPKRIIFILQIFFITCKNHLIFCLCRLYYKDKKTYL